MDNTGVADKLEHIAYVDSLLEIPNRAGCMQKLESLFDGHKQKGVAFKLTLENFKLFNDTFGYHYGNLLLQNITEYLKEMTGNKVYRYGGVEFILLLEDYSYGNAVDLADEILMRFESTWRINDMDCICAANIGMVTYPQPACDVSHLVEFLGYATDEAIYNGQNQMAVFDSTLEEKIRRKRHIAELLKDCVSNGTLELRYRPSFHTVSQRFSRAESYLRLFSSEYGVLYAAEFMPIAENIGIVCTINNFAIRKTCEVIKDLLDNKCNFESIAVIISPVQFLQSNFVEDVQKILKETGIPASKLAFEISESILINSYNACNIVMQELSDLGIEFILNDFGTGYSGINNILSLPVNVLKLERLFVWQLETNPKSSSMIEGLIQIAHKLDLKVIAEGLETENQNEQLKAYGCDYLQGFYYSPTIEADMMEALFLNQ